MRRAVDCTCGEHFEARSDSELLDAFRRHADEEHSEWTEADVKAHLVRFAYDNVPEGAQA
jgi:predicted small metal-binding protein